MASLASSVHFTGSRFIVNDPHSQSHPTTVKSRPLRVSASACASATEKRKEHYTDNNIITTLPHRARSTKFWGFTGHEIKLAYRKLARVLQPDAAAAAVVVGNGRNENTAYEFMKLHEAYETLSDPEKRADYDRTLFRRRRPLSSPFAVSGATYTMRWTWETDRCW